MRVLCRKSDGFFPVYNKVPGVKYDTVRIVERDYDNMTQNLGPYEKPIEVDGELISYRSPMDKTQEQIDAEIADAKKNLDAEIEAKVRDADFAIVDALQDLLPPEKQELKDYRNSLKASRDSAEDPRTIKLAKRPAGM